MRISDSVANYILQLLQETNGTAEIQRNELAQLSGLCAQPRSITSSPPASPRSRAIW